MVGIIIGYLLGAMAADAKEFGIEGWFSWRRAIFTQGIALYIIAAFFMCYPNEKLDIMAVEDCEESGATFNSERRDVNQIHDLKTSPRSGSKAKNLSGIPILNDVFSLICNPIYMSTMLIITSMYFSVTGLQFWTI